MKPDRRLQAGFALLAVVTVAGTIGFVVVEDLSALNALYMTVISITTVGFGEVGGELSDSGKVLTMLVIVFGMGAALYTAVTGLDFGLERLIGGERRQRRVQQQIDGLNDHVILCGFGQVGSTAWEALTAQDATVVVVDSDPERVTLAEDFGALTVLGDATRDDVLDSAGVERARVLVSAVQSDSDNLVITLSAKARRESLLVVARAVEAETEKKLYLAGADRVVAPQQVGGQRLATLALKPDLAEFIELVAGRRTVEFQVEEFTLVEGTSLIGRSLRDIDLRRNSGALVLAIGDTQGKLLLNPDPAVPLRSGQILIGVGTNEQLDRLRDLLAVEA